MDAYWTAFTGLQLKEIAIGYSQDFILCDTSTGQPRPVVPTSWRRNVFQAIHDLLHPSIRVTRKLVAARFVWKGISKQVRERAKACVSCLLSKVQRHVKSPLEPFKVPHRRFEHIHVDLVGLLPQSQGFT